MASIETILRGDLLTAIRRFPLPVLCAVLLAVIHWDPFDRSALMPLTYGLAALFFWTWTMALLAEGAGRRLIPAALGLAGLLVIYFAFDLLSAAHVLFDATRHDGLPRHAAPQHFLFGFIVLSTALAPYLAGGRSQSAYWQFSHKWVVAFAAAGLGALLAWIGYWVVVETSEILFGILRTPEMMEKGGTVAICLVFPLIWLTLTPVDLSEETRTGKDQEFTSRAVGLLVAYILIPVTLILSGLLAVYVVKTLIEGAFLTSRLGFTAALYAAGIILVALMAYPQRNESGYIGLFWRAFPYLLVAPILLLIAALWVRIAEYGWTPQRYLAALTAVWAVIVAVCFMVPRWSDLRVIAGAAALLLGLAAYGPWGVAEVSGRSQFVRLEALLTEKGWLTEGRWTKPEYATLDSQSGELSTVRTMFGTIEAMGQVHRIRGWFAGLPDDPFAAPAIKRMTMLRERLALLPDQQPMPRYRPARNEMRLLVPTPYRFRMEPRSAVIGPVALSGGPQTLADTPLGDLTVSINENGIITVEGERGRKEVDCEAAFKDAAGPLSTPNEVWIAQGTGDLPLKLAITSISTLQPDGGQREFRGNAYLLIESP